LLEALEDYSDFNLEEQEKRIVVCGRDKAEQKVRSVTLTEALLLQLDFAGDLCEVARRTAEGRAAISAAATLDPVPSTRVPAVHALKDKSSTEE